MDTLWVNKFARTRMEMSFDATGLQMLQSHDFIDLLYSPSIHMTTGTPALCGQRRAWEQCFC